MDSKIPIFSFEFSLQEVEFLQAFFEQFIPKLGQGVWKDKMQALEKRFDKAFDKFEYPCEGNNYNQPKIF